MTVICDNIYNYYDDLSNVEGFYRYSNIPQFKHDENSEFTKIRVQKKITNFVSGKALFRCTTRNLSSNNELFKKIKEISNTKDEFILESFRCNETDDWFIITDYGKVIVVNTRCTCGKNIIKRVYTPKPELTRKITLDFIRNCNQFRFSDEFVNHFYDLIKTYKNYLENAIEKEINTVKEQIDEIDQN